MPGFTSRDNVVNAYANGQTESYAFNKSATGRTWNGNVWYSLRVDAGKPGAETNPTAGNTQNYTGGNINFPSRSATAGYRRSLLSFSAIAGANSQGVLALYDRIQAVGANFAIATNRAPTTSVNVGRYISPSGTESAANNQLWIEYATAAAAGTSATHAVTYVDSSATSRSGTLFTTPNAAAPIGAMYRYPILPTSGSIGITSVTSVTGTAVTNSGTGNYVIMKPIAYLNISVAHAWTEVNFLDNILTMPRIHNDANLQLVWLPTATGGNATISITGVITTVYN